MVFGVTQANTVEPLLYVCVVSVCERETSVAHFSCVEIKCVSHTLI